MKEETPGRGWILSKDYTGSYKVVYQDTTSKRTEESVQEQLRAVAKHLNELEIRAHNQAVELQEGREKLASLLEEVKLFSTFEQICNSGMLRNFKIDPESDFAQVILGLLQRTMELQIDTLVGERSGPKRGTQTPPRRINPHTGPQEIPA